MTTYDWTRKYTAKEITEIARAQEDVENVVIAIYAEDNKTIEETIAEDDNRVLGLEDVNVWSDDNNTAYVSVSPWY